MPRPCVGSVSHLEKKDHQMPQEQKNMKMPKELCK